MAHRKTERNSLFAGRGFEDDIILLCLRWYFRFKLSCRNRVAILAERRLSIATDVGIQDILQCATRDYRHRAGAEDSQTPVRNSDPMAIDSRSDLASRHGSIVRIAARHSWSYRSDNPICTRTPCVAYSTATQAFSSMSGRRRLRVETARPIRPIAWQRTQSASKDPLASPAHWNLVRRPARSRRPRSE